VTVPLDEQSRSPRVVRGLNVGKSTVSQLTADAPDLRNFPASAESVERTVVALAYTTAPALYVANPVPPRATASVPLVISEASIATVAELPESMTDVVEMDCPTIRLFAGALSVSAPAVAETYCVDPAVNPV
jgi:hypothetical protein